jgi:hypothetical protein
MTLDELILELQAIRNGGDLPGDAEVLVEGCDCIGELLRPVVDDGDLVLARTDGDWKVG